LDTAWLRSEFVLVGVGVVVGVLVGFLAGQRSRREAKKLARLQAELEASRAELADYRGQVSQHFGRTSDLLRRLTIQYRTVYEHLADGARTLCPEGAVALATGAEEATLPPEAGAAGSRTEPDLAAEPDLGPELSEESPHLPRGGAEEPPRAGAEERGGGS
jgi:uncharacterized membrane-anchored protein YhcB (DUF1043 family)